VTHDYSRGIHNSRKIFIIHATKSIFNLAKKSRCNQEGSQETLEKKSKRQESSGKPLNKEQKTLNLGNCDICVRQKISVNDETK
jgi:hypothetical protein